MMYSNNNNNLVNISGFKIYKDKFLFCDKNKGIFDGNGFIRSNIDGTSLVFHEDYIFFLSSVENISYYLIENKLYEILHPLWLHTIEYSTVLGYQYTSISKSFKIFIFDFYENKILKEIDKELDLWNLIRCKNTIFYFNSSKTKISALSLLTSEYAWEVDLGVEGLQVGGILGIKDNNLMVACTDKQHQGIWLALDVATGEEVWRRSLQISYGGTYAFNEDKTSIFYLHAKGVWLNGIQVVKGSNIFREINTKDGSVRREGVLWQLDEVGLGINNCTLQNGFIYFTAHYSGSFGATVIGVLDYETLSLLWWEEVKLDEANGFGNFLTQLQVSENKIYVLDKTHVLHIYEKDESIPFVKPTQSGLMPFENLPIKTQNNENQNFDNNDDLPF